ncbi:2063_t:CDS:2 [Funneliformis mosseae]|uniref:2063_t:CDS:1 n=1 Tax=Funneliformis mosseae TaxID=27381 RepID=A0A9N9CPT8_FUNMO|nr:2063_t:CDS:2 [Funneliformis mosseae]
MVNAILHKSHKISESFLHCNATQGLTTPVLLNVSTKDVNKKTFIVVAFVNKATQQPISPPTILNACTRSENNECLIKAGEKFNQTLEVKLPIKKTNATDISFIPVRTKIYCRPDTGHSHRHEELIVQII